jgi:hypothetical protein
MSKVLAFVPRPAANVVAGTMNLHGSVVRAMPDAARRQAAAAADYTVENKGTLLLLRSTNAGAYEWLVKHTDPEAHWFGRALVVEYGYIDDFVERLRCDGFSVLDLDGVVAPKTVPTTPTGTQ